MVNYSQYDEQGAILAAFNYDADGHGHGPDKADCRFLDIGGYHPTDKSNTRALVELGWGGVIIEPSPGPMINFLRGCVWCGNVPREYFGDRHKDGTAKPCEKCGSLETYGLSERFTLIMAGVGLVPGLVNFHASDDLISTTDEAQREVWGKVGGYYGRYLCPIITLGDISNQFGGFDFINLDAEGHSAELFLEMLRIGMQATCVCVEHDQRLVELAAKATAKQYSLVYSNSTNGVFVRK